MKKTIEIDGHEFQPVLFNLEEAAEALERVVVAVRAGLCHDFYFDAEGDGGLIWFLGTVVIEDKSTDENPQGIVYGEEVTDE